MNVLTYLQKKYEMDRPLSMLRSEAKIFGIPYPLVSGWLEKYGSTEITEGMAYRLQQSLLMKKKKGKYLHAAIQVACDLPAVQEIKPSPPPPPRPPKPKKQKSLSKKQKLRAQPDNFIPIPRCDVAGNEFLQSYEWRRVRMMALKKYGPKCQCCGATPATGAIMNVDHIKPRKLYPELALDVSNLQILCHECNHGKGNWDMTDWRDKSTTP